MQRFREIAGKVVDEREDKPLDLIKLTKMLKDKEKFMKELVNDQRTKIEPIIREQLYRDSVDILARVVNEYESIEGKGVIGVIYRATCKFFGFGDFEKLHSFKMDAKTKLDEYSVKVGTQEVEQKELLGRKTTVFNNREDTDNYLTMDITGESYERRKNERTFTENLMSNLGSALRRKTKT